MSVLFTEKLKDYFQRNTSLLLVKEDGDLEIEGTIEDFSLSPVAPTAEGGRDSQYFSGLTRLTLRINASYLNNQDDQFNYENKIDIDIDLIENIVFEDGSSISIEEIKKHNKLWGIGVFTLFFGSIATAIILL